MTTMRERRAAAAGLGVLAAALLAAGFLPWLVAGPVAARLLALPLLLMGGAAAVTAARLPALRLARRRRAPNPAARRIACADCTCGAPGTCAATVLD